MSLINALNLKTDFRVYKLKYLLVVFSSKFYFLLNIFKNKVVNRLGFFLMKKKLNFESKIILLKRIENIFGKSENFFCKIIKNIFFENKKSNRKFLNFI